MTYWQLVEGRGAPAEGETGAANGQPSKGRNIPILKCYVVFNNEQIEWPTGSTHAAEASPSDADDNQSQVEQVIASAGACIEHQGTRASYSLAEDRIVVPVWTRFENPAAYYATVLHEHAHWTGHEIRLGRDLKGRLGSDSYAAEELVAELAAAFLSADLGIENHVQHAEYISAWVKVLRSDKRAIF